MNWKKTLCGMLLVGATSSFGCARGYFDVREPIEKTCMEKLNYKVEYDTNWKWFKISAQDPRGYVELTYCALGKKNLKLRMFFRDEVSIHDIGANGKVDSIYHLENSSCYKSGNPKCPKDQLGRGTEIFEEYKAKMDFDAVLKAFERKQKSVNYLEGVE